MWVADVSYTLNSWTRWRQRRVLPSAVIGVHLLLAVAPPRAAPHTGVVLLGDALRIGQLALQVLALQPAIDCAQEPIVVDIRSVGLRAVIGRRALQRGAVGFVD